MADDERIEFDSMINLRPGQHNRSRSVESAEIRQKIIKIVNKLIEDENEIPSSGTSKRPVV